MGLRVESRNCEKLRTGIIWIGPFTRRVSMDLGHGERESVVTIPPAVRPAVARAEPATTAVTARAQQARTVVGVVDGFMHVNDVPQTHRFDLLVRELLADE